MRSVVLVLALAGARGPAPARGSSAGASADLAAGDECAAAGTDCALSALQRRAQRRHQPRAQLASPSLLADFNGASSSCHTAIPGDVCYDEVMWARNEGMVNHPDWYPGLTPQSTIIDIQELVHSRTPSKCPRPCGLPIPTPWCQGNDAPDLWSPDVAGPPMNVKILTYNLFWWSLFQARRGNGNSAGKLIQANMDPPFDVMGFQECENPDAVLGPVGLLDQYQAFQGPHAICMAYNKKAWELLANGEAEVGEDMPTRYYGKRGSQWMRLVHKYSGKKLFFINHHGPLSVNSGGLCGGEATAHNLVRVMATKARHGDTIVLVGDFNSNAASLTIQHLWTHLVHVFGGTSFGGVDNIFSNADNRAITTTKIMGPGGSDHDAITATIEVGLVAARRSIGTEEVHSHQAVLALTGHAKPGYEWQEFWCGLIEDKIEYVPDPTAWTRSTAEDIADPEHCCRQCQAEPRCASWTWKDFSEATQGAECLMSSVAPARKREVDGFVSGLAYTEAARDASRAAAYAVERL